MIIWILKQNECDYSLQKGLQATERLTPNHMLNNTTMYYTLDLFKAKHLKILDLIKQIFVGYSLYAKEFVSC